MKNIEAKLEKYYHGIDIKVDTQRVDSWSKTDGWLLIVGKIGPSIYAAIAMGDQAIVMWSTADRKGAALLSTTENRFLKLVSPKRLGIMLNDS